MNRHVLFFAQRVASAAASSLVYALADKYGKSSGFKTGNKKRKKQSHYKSEPNPYPTKPYRKSETTRARAHKPHYSMAEQMEDRKRGQG